MRALSFALLIGLVSGPAESATPLEIKGRNGKIQAKRSNAA